MQTKSSKTSRLTARDFVFVYEPGIGQTYQNGPYLITVPRIHECNCYGCFYRGQRFSWGHEDFTSAVEAVAKFEDQRRSLSNPFTIG